MADSLTLIQQEYDKLKGNLDNINQSIRKFNWKKNQNGFNPHGREIERNNNKSNGLIVRIQNNFFNESQSHIHSLNGTINDHEYNDNISINNDESLSEGELDESEEKPKLQSSVIQIIRPVKSREEAMVSSADKSLVARNKRMFNYLLGTLDKFKKETDNVKEKMKIIHRKEIEEKLDEKVVQEKQDMIVEKRKLFREQIDAKNKIKALEIKMEILKLEEAWEDYQKRLKVFIKTKTQPSIFYLPSTMTPETQTRLEESIKVIEQCIVERRSAIEEELAKLDDPTTFFDQAIRQIKGRDHVTAKDGAVGGGGSVRQERLANLNYVIFQFRRAVEQKIRAIEAGKIFDPRVRGNELKRRRHRSRSEGGRSKRSRGSGRGGDDREGNNDKSQGSNADHSQGNNTSNTAAAAASMMMAGDILPEDETCVNVPLNVGDITTTTSTAANTTTGMEQASYLLDGDHGALGALNFSTTFTEQAQDGDQSVVEDKVDGPETPVGIELTSSSVDGKTSVSDHVTNLPDGE